MPVRIYEIAKKLNLESKFVLNKAKELGIAAAKVPSSTLDKITAEFLEEQLAPLAKPVEPPKPLEMVPVTIIHALPPEPPPAEAAQPQSVVEAVAEAGQHPVSEAVASATSPEPVVAPESPVGSADGPAPAPVPSAEVPPVSAAAPESQSPAAAASEAPEEPVPVPPAPPTPPPVQTGQLIGRIDLSQFGYGGRTTRGVSSPPPARPGAPAARDDRRGPAGPQPGRPGMGGPAGLRPGQPQRPGVSMRPGQMPPRPGGPGASGPRPAPAPARPQVAADAPTIIMRPPIVVRELAEQMGKKPFQIIGDLMQMNVFATVTQTIDAEAAIKICAKHGIRFETEKRDKAAHVVNVPKEEKLELDTEDKPETLCPRPPVITIMGHVDHGKTSLLDVIRKANVASGEAGGITQHIGAYTIQYPHPNTGKLESLTFLDTPGHAAFSAMRARGANVTDIVVLVVAANDGVMPQTLEALSHAKAAKVPIIVAVNKCDHPNSNPMKVRQQLQDKGLVPDDWGGDTLFVECSAITKKGIDTLIDSILLQAELLELKANPDRNAKGNVIESGVEAGGPVATVLVRKGTLHIGDVIICGEHYGKVRAMMNEEGLRLKEATPSVAVRVLGLNGVPDAGSEFSAVENERAARDLAEERSDTRRKSEMEGDRRKTRASLSDLFGRIGDLSAKVLKVIVKADTQGSVEAIVGALREIKSQKVSLEVVHSAVGAINVSDVNLARGSKAVILAFHTRVDNNAAEEAKHHAVEIRLYAIIYELIDQVKDAMAGLLDPLLKDVVIGQAEVRKIFDLSKGGRVAGCAVTTGRLVRGKMRLRRRGNLVYEGVSLTLKRFQDEVNEVRSGMECGVRLDGFDDYQEGDLIECYSVEKIAAKLE
ncbi:MAG: translation initiation factor IF-2 [Verrucomicrobia bacterium]|nr:translation initiation factor IF-2 [Verrucomicrobiota bacterium]